MTIGPIVARNATYLRDAALVRNAVHPKSTEYLDSAVYLRRHYLSHNTSVRPETAGPLRKVINMSLMIEELSRDRMRTVQRDVELARTAQRLRQRNRQARPNAKNP